MSHNYIILIITLLTCSTITSTYSRLINDGVHDDFNGSRSSVLEPLISSQNDVLEELCAQTYGFMPCTNSITGNLFLILVYGYLMFLAATYLSSGSELMLEILGPGIVGGLFLPILGSLPDALLILGTKK